MMECSCNIDVGNDYDGPAFTDQRVCVARKAHRCHECRREITPGESYERFTGKWDGEIDTYKTCPDCLAVRDSMLTQGFYFQMVWEHVLDHIRETESLPEDCLAALTPRAREKCCTILESVWEGDEDEDED